MGLLPLVHLRPRALAPTLRALPMAKADSLTLGLSKLVTTLTANLEATLTTKRHHINNLARTS